MQALLTSMCSCSAPINLNGACAKIPVMEAHGLGMATSNFATFSDALKKLLFKLLDVRSTLFINRVQCHAAFLFL